MKKPRAPYSPTMGDYRDFIAFGRRILTRDIRRSYNERLVNEGTPINLNSLGVSLWEALKEEHSK